jgi:hypothetical protein
VLYEMRGGEEVVYCDLELVLPDAMRAELKAALAQTGPPSRKSSIAYVWDELVRKYSSALVCGVGFRRMTDTASGAPSVRCRREVTASALCPRPGTTFIDGTCYAQACPEGSMDLERSTDGRLAGCSRCPAGQLDVEESVARRDLPSWSSSSGRPVAAVLCKAGVTDACPALRGSAPAPGGGDLGAPRPANREERTVQR